MTKFYVGDIIEVIDSNNGNSLHDLRVGHQYIIKAVYTTEPRYLVEDFDFSNGIWFAQALYSDEIKLIKRSKNILKFFIRKRR